jgi:type IV fimbrial biogenesis protein FimT
MELMVALTVLGILVGIGVPSFANIMRNNQIAAQSSSFMQALTLARSEAMKRGLRVSICPIANNDSSECTADWNGGWMVFEDDLGTVGLRDAGDEPIQLWPAPSSGVTVSATETSVVYMPSAAVVAARTFLITKEGCNNDQRRQITIGASGRVNLSRISCVDETEEGS